MFGLISLKDREKLLDDIRELSRAGHVDRGHVTVTVNVDRVPSEARGEEVGEDGMHNGCEEGCDEDECVND